MEYVTLSNGVKMPLIGYGASESDVAEWVNTLEVK